MNILLNEIKARHIKKDKEHTKALLFDTAVITAIVSLLLISLYIIYTGA